MSVSRLLFAGKRSVFFSDFEFVSKVFVDLVIVTGFEKHFVLLNFAIQMVASMQLLWNGAESVATNNLTL